MPKKYPLLCLVATIFLYSCCNVVPTEYNSKVSANNESSYPFIAEYNIKESDIEIVNNQASAVDLIKNINPISDFDWAAIPAEVRQTKSIAFDIETVRNSSLNLSCLRSNKNQYYSVHIVKNADGAAGYGFIFYKDSMVYDGWFVIKIPDKSDFSNIKNNQTTFSEIKEYDSSVILLEETEGNDGKSYHRFSDGTMAVVSYENSNGSLIVSNCIIEKDPVDFVHILLLIDLKLIK